MSDIGAVNLVNQMRAMAAQAEGASVSSNQNAFSAVFQQALGEVNQSSKVADSMKARYEMGDPDVSLADVMIAGQKSNLGFEAALMVRNKVVQAYQDVMSMPV